MRKIIHVDMDAFFAAVEQRDDPALQGKPVIVGGGERRGVVSAASYEARRFGVRSAMPIFQARRLCPQGVYLPTRMARYREVSEEIDSILSSFTPIVEKVSLDESFLDASGSEALFGPAVEIAKRIKAEIKEVTGLTASAGVAPNKFLAKIASDLKKPDGLVVVEPDQVEAFLKDLPVSRIWGVGEVTERALKGMGIHTIGELAKRLKGELTLRFGKAGERLHQLSRGIDDDPVVPYTPPKSIGHEETFEEDVADLRLLGRVLLSQSERVAARAREGGFRGRTVTLKLKYSDFTQITRSGTLAYYTDRPDDIYQEALRQLHRVDLSRKQVRLIGVSLSGFPQEAQEEQLNLFDRRGKRLDRAAAAVDKVRGRFGNDSLLRASLIELEED